MRKISYVQKVMIGALIQLMKSNTFKEITITQLTQEAKVARKTFYLNFNSKESVVKLAIKQMSGVFQTYLPDDSKITLEKLATAFFSFSKDNIELIELLIKNQIFMLLADEFEIFIEEKIVLSESIHLIDNFRLKELPSNYVISYHSAGLCRLLEKWISLGMKESPMEMGKIYIKLVQISDL